MDADPRRWWCPACLRMHGLGEVLPFKQLGVEEYTCRESGAVVHLVAEPLTAPASADDELRYWCPACMRIHTPEEVTPFMHGAEHGVACRLSGAVVEELNATASTPSQLSTPPAGATTARPVSSVNDPNLQTAAEVAGTSAPPPVANHDDQPISHDTPADTKDHD